MEFDRLVLDLDVCRGLLAMEELIEPGVGKTSCVGEKLVPLGFLLFLGRLDDDGWEDGVEDFFLFLKDLGDGRSVNAD